VPSSAACAETEKEVMKTDKACLGGLGTEKPCPGEAVTERTVDGIVFDLCARHAREIDEERRPRPKRKKLDLEAPLGSLLEVAKLSKTELARRRGVERGAVQSAVRAGRRIGLDLLIAYAERAGLDLELSVRPRQGSTSSPSPKAPAPETKRRTRRRDRAA
jgi:hypothetical protein